MSKYLDLFPKIQYQINQNATSVNNYQTATDLMFRLGVINSYRSNLFQYDTYIVKDGETPEILADKIYGDPEAHWLILLANNVVDPQYDWILNYRDFINYIISKYGSVATAKTQVHHYEKIRQTVDQSTGKLSETIVEISADEYTNGGLPTEPGSPIFSGAVGRYSVDVYDFYKRAIYAYDWEVERNEKKRNINIIRAEYWPIIRQEFNNMVSNAAGKNVKIPGIRSLRR